jgi:hypothetical protein
MPDPGAAAAPLAGKRARTQVNGTNIKGAHGWKLKVLADNIDTTSFEDVESDSAETYETSIDGVHRAQGSVTLFVDSDNIPNVAYGLVEGGTLTNLYLFVDKRIAARRWSFPFAKILDVDWGAEVKGGQEVTVSFKGQGKFTGPA